MESSHYVKSLSAILMFMIAAATNAAAQAPMLSSSNAVTYFENGAAVPVNNMLFVFDPDNTTLQSATVSITNCVAGQDFLGVSLSPATGNINYTINNTTGVIILTSAGSTATVAQFQTALRTITYVNTSENPVNNTRVINYTVSDGTFASNTLANFVNVIPVNDAPVITGNSSVSFIENGPAVILNSGITLTDPDNTTFSSATVTITGPLSPTQDILSFTTSAATGNITGGYSFFTGVLNLTSAGSTATLAQFQAALRSVTYSNNSDEVVSTVKNISFVVNDGNLQSNSISTFLQVTGINDAPVIAGAAGATFTENGSPVIINNNILVSDPDNLPLFSATVAITNYVQASEFLSFTANAATGNISGSFNLPSGILTLSSAGPTATAQQFQAALRTVTYFNYSDDPGNTPKLISFVVNDGFLLSNTLTTSVNIFAVNDAPVITGGGNVATYIENGAGVQVNNNISITDLDNTTMQSAAVTITNAVYGQDILSFTPSATTGNITAIFDPFSGTLNLSSSGATATLAQFINALRSVTYSNSSDNPVLTARTLNYKVFDGGLNSNTVTSYISVVAVNDAPVLASSIAVAGYFENQPPQIINNLLTVSDPDNTTLSTAAISVTPFTMGDDSLVFFGGASTGNISAYFNSATATLTLTSAGATATLNQFQSALHLVGYYNRSDNPAAGTRNINFTVNDGGLNSNTIVSFVNVTASNDAPVLSGIEVTPLGYPAGAAPVNISNSITPSDIDNLTLSIARITVTPVFAAEDVLSFTNTAATGNIVGSYNNATGMLMLQSGGNTATIAQWQNALRTVKYSNSSATPSLTTRVVSFSIGDGALNSNVQNRNVVVGVVLPVTLADITALNAGAVNKIQWQTASETFDNRFELERSGDAVHFAHIAFITAAGYATTYNYIDQQPLTGINYYRLKMISQGQATTYSAIVYAKTNVPAAALTVFPNPASGAVNITLAGGNDELIRLLDVNGKILLSRNLNNGKLLLDVQQLSAGIYFIQTADSKDGKILIVNNP